jgi:DNA-binding transcriptional ArsR family regulator
MINHMVDESPLMDAVFHALANGVRRQMLLRLADGDLTVGELAQPLSVTLAAASKHIKVLERVGLIRQTVSGRQHLCRLEVEPLASATAWLRYYERFWTERLDAMEALFPAPARPFPPANSSSTDVPAQQREKSP